jgi:hypothetical protein
MGASPCGIDKKTALISNDIVELRTRTPEVI